jgi:hypothetical protein
MGVTTDALAFIAAALLVLGAAFQIGLAAGAPWGTFAYGGRAAAADGSLPWRWRFASAVAAVVLLGAIWVVLAAASLIDRGPVSPSALTVVLWGMAAFFGLNVLGNAFARHPFERWVAAPAAALLAVLCALLAIGMG